MEVTQWQIQAVCGMGQHIPMHGACHALHNLSYLRMKNVIQHGNTPLEHGGTLSLDGGALLMYYHGFEQQLVDLAW